MKRHAAAIAAVCLIALAAFGQAIVSTFDDVIISGELRHEDGSLYLFDAPSNGSTYGRKDGAWVVAGGGGGGGISDAPNDGVGYVRRNTVWTQSAWSYLTGTPTTLSGYGITDAASDSELAAHAALTSGVHGITSFSSTLLDDTTAAAWRSTLGLGNSATLNTGTSAGTVALGNHSHAGVYDPAGTAAAAVAAHEALGDPHSVYLTQTEGDARYYRPGIGLPGSDITSGTVAPARLGSGTPGAGNFLRGDGTWAAPAGGLADAPVDASTYGRSGGAWAPLGNAATRNVGTAAGTVAHGDHLHTGVYLPMTGGTISGGLGITANLSAVTGENFLKSAAGGIHGGNVERWWQAVARMQSTNHLGTTAYMEVEAVALANNYSGQARRSVWRIVPRSYIRLDREDWNGGVGSLVRLRIIADTAKGNGNGVLDRYVVGVIAGSASGFHVAYIRARRIEAEGTSGWTRFVEMASAAPTFSAGSAMEYAGGAWVAAAGFVNETPSENVATVWTSDIDGPGSGLDADKLDGLESSAFASAFHSHAASEIGGGLVNDTEFSYLDGVSSSIQGQLNGKASTAHTHDDRYFTEAETTSLLSTKANASHTHPAASIGSGLVDDSEFSFLNNVISPIQDQLNGKASSSHSHNASHVGFGSVDDLEFSFLDGVTSDIQSQLNGKASTSHNHDGYHARLFGSQQTISAPTVFSSSLSASGLGADVSTSGDYRIIMRDNATQFLRPMTASYFRGWADVPTTGDVAGKAAINHQHSGADIVSGTVAPQRLGSGTPNSANFLRGSGVWGSVLLSDISGASSFGRAWAALADAVAGRSALALDSTATTLQAVANHGTRVNSGGSVSTRRRLNVIGAGSVSVSMTDDPSSEETDLTITGTGGGGGGDSTPFAVAAFTCVTTGASSEGQSLIGASSSGVTQVFRVEDGLYRVTLSANQPASVFKRAECSVVVAGYGIYETGVVSISPNFVSSGTTIYVYVRQAGGTTNFDNNQQVMIRLFAY